MFLSLTISSWFYFFFITNKLKYYESPKFAWRTTIYRCATWRVYVEIKLQSQIEYIFDDLCIKIPSRFGWVNKFQLFWMFPKKMNHVHEDYSFQGHIARIIHSHHIFMRKNKKFEKGLLTEKSTVWVSTDTKSAKSQQSKCYVKEWVMKTNEWWGKLWSI